VFSKKRDRAYCDNDEQKNAQYGAKVIYRGQQAHGVTFIKHPPGLIVSPRVEAQFDPSFFVPDSERSQERPSVQPESASGLGPDIPFFQLTLAERQKPRVSCRTRRGVKSARLGWG
jgi:hypothetical protein